MSRQVENVRTKQIRIDKELHKILRIKSAEESTTIRSLVERMIEGAIREKHK